MPASGMKISSTQVPNRYTSLGGVTAVAAVTDGAAVALMSMRMFVSYHRFVGAWIHRVR